MREATLAAVRFPDPLHLPRGGRGPARALARVDDPVADRIAKGDPTLGWAGDNRLQLYIDVPEGQWELWRLEHDDVLRKVANWSVDQYRSTDIVPAVILWLRRHDQRTGFDPFVEIVAAEDRARAKARAASEEQVAEAADRLAFGLRKDGAL